jgi:hypothetical protein
MGDREMKAYLTERDVAGFWGFMLNLISDWCKDGD